MYWQFLLLTVKTIKIQKHYKRVRQLDRFEKTVTRASVRETFVIYGVVDDYYLDGIERRLKSARINNLLITHTVLQTSGSQAVFRNC